MSYNFIRKTLLKSISNRLVINMEKNSKKASGKTNSFSRSPAKFSILTWNLDGLDDNNLQERTVAVVDLVEKKNYSIIFFQELIAPTFQYIASRLKSKYVPVLGTHNPNFGYFTATFLRIHTVEYIDHEIVNFPGTIMERKLLITRCRIDQIKLVVCNTHLESTAAYASERVKQLKMCFERCNSFAPEWNVIFGGDLNARDSEVKGKLPSNMCDLWIKCGSNRISEFTWDLTRNKNKQMPSMRQPQCRFDRLYYRESVPMSIVPEFFGLTGFERVYDTESFASDHWGVVVFFQAVN